MIYRLLFDREALEDLRKLERYEPKAFKKAERLLSELREHPRTGLGHPEPLKGKPEGRWSRELTKKHRLVYSKFKIGRKEQTAKCFWAA